MTRPVTAEGAKALLEQALRQFAPDWDITDECQPVNMGDPTHWPSGVQSVRAVLRHRNSGRVKVLGQRVVNGPETTCHRALSLVVLEAYRDGNTDPMRRYLEEIGAVSASGARVASIAARPGPVRAWAREAPSAPPASRAVRPAAASVGRSEPPAGGSGAESDLAGSFAALGLADVLQALALGRKTGRLLVTFDRDSGGIVLDNGAPVHAQIGMQSGPDAVAALLVAAHRQPGARFVFRSQRAITRDEPRTIHESLQHLLFAAAVAIDEEDGAQLVSLDAARSSTLAV